MLIALIAGATLGLANLPHCAAMCGPLSGLACSRASRSGPIRYHLGRVFGYSTAGAVCGHLGEALSIATELPATSWIFAVAAAGACLFTAATLLRKRAELVSLRAARPKPNRYLMAIADVLPKEPLSLGVLSSLLPCGLLAAALLAAVAERSGTYGAALMFGFANGTGLALLGTAWVVRVLPQRFSPFARRGAALLLMVTAVAIIARPIVRAAAHDGVSSNSEGASCCH